MPTFKQSSKVFSFRAFRELYEQSLAMKLLSSQESQQIEKALQEKNTNVLVPLHRLLLQEKVSKNRMNRDFLTVKDKLVEKFSFEAVQMRKTSRKNSAGKKSAISSAHDRGKAAQILTQL